MRTVLVFCLIMLLSLSPASRRAGEGTVPEPVLPLMFADITFTPIDDALIVQLGLSDWDLGINRATLTFQSLSAGDSIILTYGSTDTVYSTVNTTWLVNELHADPGTWTLRQVYAKDGSGRELNLFFLGDAYTFTVPGEIPAHPQFIYYIPQASN